MTHGSVTVSIEVTVEPATAFEMFTEEIDRWWRPGPINWYDSRRAVSTRFEPGVGGRWLEIYDDDAGDVFVIGRVTAWEPGARLVVEYCDGDIDGTEIDIRFIPVEGGTRVTLEHRGWEKLDPDHAARKRGAKRSGWTNILSWYSDWAFWGSPRRVGRASPFRR
jgi:uncharacterized protein YndB with AHSA1/START domain